MDLDRLKAGAAVDEPTVSASMATALLAYSGIAVKMLVDQRLEAQLHTMFMVEYEPGGVAHPHDHPLEEAYVILEGEVEAHADSRPEQVAGPQHVRLAVGGGFHLAIENEIRFLERMVVQVGDAARLVLHHEHRVELRIEPLIHQHLHGDAAVRQQRRRHAGRDGRRVHAGAPPQRVELDVAVVDPEQVPRSRVADIERPIRVAWRRTEKNVSAGSPASTRGCGASMSIQLARPRGTEPGVRHAHGDESARAGRQRERTAVKDQRGSPSRI